MASSMKEYLQKYMGSGDAGSDGKTKKRRPKQGGKKNGGALASRGRSKSGSGVIIVDDDAPWQKDLKAEEDEEEPEGDGDAPLVVEDVEVKRMQRMEAMKTHRPYLSVANDGSGWVTVKGDQPEEEDDGDFRVENAVRGLASRLPRQDSADGSAVKRRSDSPDLSPARRRIDSPDLSPARRRNDSPDLSPARRRNDSPDLSPARRRNDSPDLAPARRRNDSPDLSPARRRNGSPGGAEGDFDSRKRKFSRDGVRDRVEDVSSLRRRMDSPDLSPPRQIRDSGERRRLDTSLMVSQRRRHGSPSPSPPRRKARHDSPTLSPPRKRRHDSASPPRGRRNSPPVSAGPADLSPPRRRRNSPPQSAGLTDLSPPRRRRNSPPQSAGFTDLSPPRRRRDSPARNADPVDLSPPRRRRGSPPKSAGPFDLSPPRRRRDSPSRDSGPADLAPPRRRPDSPSRDSSPANLSVSRRTRVSSASAGEKELAANFPSGRSRGSPPPRRIRHDSPEASIRDHAISMKSSMDSSPPRKPKASATLDHSDQLPPRKKGTSKMADGTVGGLKSVKDVASDAARLKAAEAKLLSELDPSISGRGAETVFRDRRGRKLDGLEEMLRQQKGGGKPAEQPLEWGKGLAQKKEANAALAELEEEKNKPFARYRDDVDLDKSLREAVRFGDPMAHLVSKKTAEPVLEDLGAREEMKASGFIIPQNIPNHSWLKTGANAPPNRYGIKPGRHWDGVNRSNGFEGDLFKRRNEKKAREQEAYLWSVADM